MNQAGYQMHNAPIIEASDCLIMGEDSLCVNLTGCNCSKQKDRNGKPIPLPIVLSIYSAIGIYENGKRCPNCRRQLSRFVCLPEKSKQKVRDPFDFILFRNIPQKPMSKFDFESLMEMSAKMSQGYQFTGLKNLSEQSEDALSRLAQFSRRFMSSEERDAAAPALASLARGGDGAAAPVPAHIIYEVPAQIQIEREILRDLIQLRFQELALDRADREWDAQWNAPVPAPPMRAGGGGAAPVRRPQNYSSDSESDSDFIHYIRRGS